MCSASFSVFPFFKKYVLTVLTILLYIVTHCLHLFYSVCHLRLLALFYACLYKVCVLHCCKWHQPSLWSVFLSVFSIMPRCKSWKWSCWQLLMYLQKWWWILSKINQLPKVASASSSSLLPLTPLPFLISTIHCRHAQIPDHHLSTPFSFNSPHLTLTPQPPEAPIPPSIPSRSLAHPALIYCPLLPVSPISPFFLPPTPCFFSPPLPLLSLHPSDWVMAIRAGSHPAAVWDRHWSHTQSLWAEGTAIHFVHGLVRLTVLCTI